MKTLVIISCGKRKIWDENPNHGPCQAKNAYTGPLFKLAKQYAEKYADKWLILSAKYGFIPPNFTIPENYNVTFKNPKTNPITLTQLKKQAQQMKLHQYDEIIVIGGKHYIEICKQIFPPNKLKTPFAGLPLGKMMQKIKQAIKLITK